MEYFRLLLSASEPVEVPGLSAKVVNGEITVSAFYTADPRPLVLRGGVTADSRVELHMRPYRIELWIDGRLMDEEWPCGECLLGDELPRLPLSDGTRESGGSFTNAEGWQPEPNVFVGDCMPYTHDGRYHVLYLKDRRHSGSKWNRHAHQWAHISTDDMIHWQIHPMAVEIDDCNEATICTGSWILCKEKHYLYYTVRPFDGSAAVIRRSVSDDGYHFTKDRNFSLHISEKYNAVRTRDPKMVRAADGTYHMIITSALTETRHGCLAHLVSPDLEHWSEEEPLYISPDADIPGAYENHPECPDYFELNGWHYLVFSHHHRGEYRYSREPFSGWQIPDDPYIPCKCVPKAALWNGGIVFTGFDSDGVYGGTMTFLEMTQRPDGQLEVSPAGKNQVKMADSGGFPVG